jgi:aminoglycoside phosphotransferase (APT) family kinase protein
MTAKPPPARGVRLDWPDMPARIRSALEHQLGGAVVFTETQPGGFSPGVAARVRTEQGRRAFVKAVGPELNPDSPGFHRREAAVVAALPEYAPAPRLLWTYDEGESGWIALVFEDVEGQSPAQPWRPDELDRVLDALVALSAALTPSPIHLPSASQAFATNIRGWRDIHGWERLRERPPVPLDPWSSRHLEALAELEAAAPAAVNGHTLLHMDIRADNLLLTSDRVVVVDWPHASIGAAWLDLVCFAPSVAMQGGPGPETLLARHPAARGAPADAITAAVASVAGFFTRQAAQPPPPGLPTLRAFQAAQGDVARKWLAQRTGLR